MRRILRALFIFNFLILLNGCAGMQQNTNDSLLRENNLSRVPIGLHVTKLGQATGMTKVDVYFRNNTGAFINSMYLEVYPYSNDMRVGMANNFVNSVNAGETITFQMYINTSGREWSSYKYSTKPL